MNKLSIALCLVSLVLLADVGFAMPGIPNQFWGTVTINGNPASNGTSVTATINGASVGSATVSGGSYSIIAEDPNSQNTGKTVVLFVNGVQAATDIFANGKVTELNLAITVSSPPPAPSGGGGGSGGGSSGSSVQTPKTVVQTTTAVANTSAPSGPCRERWTCDAWSECNKDGIQKRNCNDANKCGTIDDLPMTTQPCAQSETSASSSNQQGAASNSITGRFMSAVSSANATYAIGLLALIGLLAYFYKRKQPANEIKPKKR